MLAQFVTICLATFIIGSPIPIDQSTNSTVPKDDRIEVVTESAKTTTLNPASLIAENNTKLSSNTTEESNVHDNRKAATTTQDDSTFNILKAIPTTIVEGTTQFSTLADSSIKLVSDSTNVGKSETTSIQIVTPVSYVSTENVTCTTSAPSSTTESESESKEIRDKVKEVEAEPVILTVGV